MTGSTVISILIANYNNAPYIDCCLESILSQTNNKWVVYIIDDLSIDNSKEVLKRYQDNDQIKITFSNENCGYAGTLKKLIEIAETDIVGILDSDDALYPNAIEVILNYYKEYPGAEFVYSRFHKCDSDLLKCGRGFSKRIPDGQTNLDKFYVSHFKTFRKSAYYKTDGIDEKLKCAIDKDLVLKMEEVTRLHFVDKVLYKWRKRGGSLSVGGDSQKRCEDSLKIIIENTIKRRQKL